MRTPRLCLAIALLAAACGGGSQAATCSDYAAEIQTLLDGSTSGGDVEQFLEKTEEHVAHLMMEDPDRATPCVEAVLEATFHVGFEDFDWES